MNHDQIIAIRKFKDDLKECFIKYLKDNPYGIAPIVLEYVFRVIDIQYDLAELDFESWSDKMRGDYE